MLVGTTKIFPDQPTPDSVRIEKIGCRQVRVACLTTRLSEEIVSPTGLVG
jgi:hypothetical protein